MSDNVNLEQRVEVLERTVMQMTEQIKALTNAIELMNHNTATTSDNRERVNGDTPPPLEDVGDVHDVGEFKRQLESAQKKMEKKFM